MPPLFKLNVYVPKLLSAVVPSRKISNLKPLPVELATFAVTFGKLAMSVLAVPESVTVNMPPDAFTLAIVIVKSFVGVAPANKLPVTLNFCPV